MGTTAAVQATISIPAYLYGGESDDIVVCVNGLQRGIAVTITLLNDKDVEFLVPNQDSQFLSRSQDEATRLTHDHLGPLTELPAMCTNIRDTFVCTNSITIRARTDTVVRLRVTSPDGLFDPVEVQGEPEPMVARSVPLCMDSANTPPQHLRLLKKEEEEEEEEEEEVRGPTGVARVQAPPPKRGTPAQLPRVTWDRSLLFDHTDETDTDTDSDHPFTMVANMSTTGDHNAPNHVDDTMTDPPKSPPSSEEVSSVIVDDEPVEVLVDDEPTERPEGDSNDSQGSSSRVVPPVDVPRRPPSASATATATAPTPEPSPKHSVAEQIAALHDGEPLRGTDSTPRPHSWWPITFLLGIVAVTLFMIVKHFTSVEETPPQDVEVVQVVEAPPAPNAELPVPEVDVEVPPDHVVVAVTQDVSEPAAAGVDEIVNTEPEPYSPRECSNATLLPGGQESDSCFIQGCAEGHAVAWKQVPRETDNGLSWVDCERFPTESQDKTCVQVTNSDGVSITSQFDTTKNKWLKDHPCSI